MKRLFIALVSTALLLACASHNGDPAAPEAVSVLPTTPDSAPANAPFSSKLPCDVKRVFEQRCTTCHGETPRFGAPMPLVTLGDLLAPAKSGAGRVVDAVLGRVADDQRPMPPPPNARLSPADRKTLQAWADAGMPAGTEATCGEGKGGSAAPKPLSCTPDQKLRSPKKVKIDKTVMDPYYCYGVDIPNDAKRHVIGIGPHVDNDRLLHHILLFQSDEPFSKEPVRCNKTPSSDWKLVAGWAPGVGNVELPKEAGFVEEVGETHWVLQLHYNNAAGNPTDDIDDSGMDLCTTDQLRPYDADVIASGSTSFTIPPRVTYDLMCQYPWGSGLLGKGLPDTPNIHVFNVQGHMHNLGTEIEVWKIPYGRQKREKIFVNHAYDFNSQEVVDVDVDITQDDILQTKCTWKNTTDSPVKWGEATTEEMCFAFLAYYPRIVDPEHNLWKWVAPAAATLNSCYGEAR